MTEYANMFIKCWQCRSTGTRPPDGEGGEPCIYCGGTGKLPYGHLDITGIMEKFDSIMAEQAVQRTDLTTILTAIWNKVKDL